MTTPQLDMFGITDESPPPWVLDFTTVEVSHRARLFADGGTLARTLRSIERQPLPTVEMLELWRWVMSLRISLGLSAHTTVARYAEILSRYLRWCAENKTDWRDMSARDIDTWSKSLYVERGNSAHWRKVQLAGLRSFYDWRHRMGLGRNCTDGVRSPKTVKHVAKKYSMVQLRDLFRAVDNRAYNPLLGQRDKCLMLFLLATGARRDEAAAIRLDQIELAEKVGRVRFFGKGSKERVVSIEGPIVKALRHWILQRDHHPGISDTLFWSTDHGHGNHGQRLSGSAVERIVKRYAKAAGLGSWGVHRFRCTYATTLYDDGADIERIRIALGHESIETTRRYLALSDKQTSTRMKSHRQWSALGQAPEGLPGWAKVKEGIL